MILHLHLSRALSKVGWAPGTTNYCKIYPINIWQNSTIATGVLNHIICQKPPPCLQSNNAHFTCHHLKMVSGCVQFSTAIVITAKGFLSTLLRFCSHSCSMSLQDNLKIKKPQHYQKIPHNGSEKSHTLFCYQARVDSDTFLLSLCSPIYFLVSRNN